MSKPLPVRSDRLRSAPLARLQPVLVSGAPHARRLAGALALALLAGSPLAGCASHAKPAAHAGAQLSVPEVLDAFSAVGVERGYRGLNPSDPQRAEVRGRLVRYLLEEAERAHAADEYDAAVEKLARVSSLYLPSELETGLAPETLSLAKYLRRQGEPRGDEARVLSALWIEKKLEPGNPEPKQQYDMLRRWSDEARQNLGGVGEHLSGLIQVMSEHARLTPAPEVIDTLANIYAERRQELVKALGSDGESPPAPGELSFQDYREATMALSRAPLDIAGVYLVHDDFTSALARLRQLDTVTGLEPRIRTVVEIVADQKPEAPDALLALSRAYVEASEHDVARALCIYGVRTFPADARFPQCLGRIAAGDDDYAEATTDYTEAIALAPEERELYDEALEVLANLMRGEMFDSDPSETRALAEQARAILTERMQRWPDVAPPVAVEELELAVGLAEMSAGNVEQARVHFQASLDKRETTRALIQLGQLYSRLGDYEQATKYLRRALDRTTQRDADETRLKAQILEQVGDVERARGQGVAARRVYSEALGLWDGALRPSDEAPQKAFSQIRRGVLLTRLDRAKDAADAFELAMQAAPDNRETYAQILSFLVVSPPQPDLADAILSRAQRQLSLDPEWKTYFSLWVKAIAGRARVAPSGDVERLLSRLSRSDAWWGHLAQFGLGGIDYERLTGLAKSRGERTEADFYEGVRRAGVGDLAGARTLFKAVVDSQMVGFYEFQMAQELLLLDDAHLSLAPAATPATAMAGGEGGATAPAPLAPAAK
jgi:tetratricopeptide (TPR) repeat protein